LRLHLDLSQPFALMRQQDRVDFLAGGSGHLVTLLANLGEAGIALLLGQVAERAEIKALSLSLNVFSQLVADAVQFADLLIDEIEFLANVLVPEQARDAAASAKVAKVAEIPAAAAAATRLLTRG
jgi:hypothetical protein